MSGVGKPPQGLRQIVVEMKADPTEGGLNGLSASRNIENRMCVAARHVSRNRRRHEAEEGLSDAEIGKVDAGANQGWIELGGAQEALLGVLHAVALEGLPFKVGALEDFVCVAVLGRLLRLLGGCGGSEDRQGRIVEP